MEQRHVQCRRPRGVRLLDVAATLDEERRALAVYVVNWRLDEASDVELSLVDGSFGAEVQVHTIGGPEPHATNSWGDRTRIVTRTTTLGSGSGTTFTHTLEPHSITGFVFSI